ncbi:MAG: hypothetical protein A2W23_01040 [Planctomycetes bacterium RBG_16_43_13]|nr:MAG: hypothetical protein A2W23_01040 [Planctomycetes bacterium RBG_16_43_13]
MACLSLLAAGNTPTRGKYAENVKRGLSFILSCASRSGYINEGGGRGMGGSGMHGHGFATLFLAEVYGMTQETDADRETIKDVLRRAVSLIEKSQSPQGGWYYEPVSGGDEGSVTIAQVSALRSARNAGIKVNAKTIEKAVDYIKHCTHQDGLVQYSYSGGGTSAALTAAGMSVLTYLGLYQDERIEKGLDYLLDVAPFIKGDKKGGVRPGDYGWSSYYFYTSLYGSIAMFQKGGKYWERWYPSMRDELVKIQAADGSWTQYEGSSYGAAFGTGFALLILEIPYRYLPIFQN